MKKILAILLALTLVLSFAACSKKEEETALPDVIEAEENEEEQPSAGMPNPMTEYDSLEEVNQAIGSNLMTPAVMGVGDQKYFVIDCGDYKIGEVQFCVAGVSYRLRAAKVGEDISGYHIGDGTAFAGSDEKKLTFVEDGDAKLARWFAEEMQYVLMTANGTDAFTDIATEMQNMVADLAPTEPTATPEPSAAPTAAPTATPTTVPTQQPSDDLSGEYYDSAYSHRAMMTVEKSGDGYQITVSWGSSAFERGIWTMNTSAPVQGRLNYSNGTAMIVTTADDGSQEQEIIADGQQGFFEVNPRDGRLSWSGAPDEQCQQCIFAKTK